MLEDEKEKLQQLIDSKAWLNKVGVLFCMPSMGFVLK